MGKCPAGACYVLPLDSARFSRYLLRMVSTVENTQPAPVKRQKTFHSKDTRQAVHAMYVAGIAPLRISRETGVPANTVNKWITRGGWTAGKDTLTRVGQNAVASTITREVERQSTEVLGLLAGELAAQARLLAKNKPKTLGALALGRTATVNTLATACDKVFGWSRDGGPRCLVQIGTLTQIDENTTTYRHCGVAPGAVVDITEDKPAESDLNR